MTTMAASPPPFQAFLDEHRGPVLSFLRAMVGPQEADDVFQETFIAALRAYRRMDGRNPRAWVLTIARRKAIDHYRSRSRRAEPRADVPEVPVHDPPPGEGEVWTAVAELSDGQRAAVALRFAADLPYAEIGRALEISEDAARRRVHDGLSNLRARIDEEDVR
jgi:RNA polymerase sigma factor (sigma-70 family)